MRILEADVHVATLVNGAKVWRGNDAVIIDYDGMILHALYNRAREWVPTGKEELKFDIENKSCGHRIFAWIMLEDPLPFDISDQEKALEVLDKLTK